MGLQGEGGFKRGLKGFRSVSGASNELEKGLQWGFKVIGA